ncbi:MAG: molybdate ABC transporter substrate-binding protein, partial [Nocardioidaceae bacterium]
MRRAVAAASAATLLLGMTACGGSDDAASEDTLTVLAASSLTEAFGELEKTYEREHDVDVEISYDSSSILASQVVEGAPADVLATADEPTMQTVVDEGLADGEPTVFATNTLTIVTPADNPAGIEGIDDLAHPDVDFAVCVPDAPCGDASERLLDLNDIDADPATEEENVK